MPSDDFANRGSQFSSRSATPGRHEIRQFYDRWTPVMVNAAGTTLQGGLVKRSATASVDSAESSRYLAERAGVAPGDRILDAGCGVGGPALAVAEAIPRVVIEGVTNSTVQAAMARQFVLEAGMTDRVRVHLADFHHLPFIDRCFDVVIFLEVTGYSSDRAALYQEVMRVLRPGGTVYVKDLFRREDPLTAVQSSSMATFDRLWCCVRSPTLSETERAMRTAGFTEINSGEFPYIDMEHYYESMVSRDANGIRLNSFGEAFFTLLPDLPVLFGEVKAQAPR